MAEEVALQLGVQRDQSFIADELEMMQGFLMAAHDERNDNKVVTVWVKQVREVSYAVEDSLLDFAVRLERQSWWCLSRTLRDRRYVAKQMKALRAKVEEVSQRNQRYHLIRGSASKPTSSAAVSGATMSVVDEAMRQQDNAKQGLLGLINSKNDVLRVIAVWGTGDISIIKSAYEDSMMHKKFDCHAWIRLIRPFSQTDFIRSTLRQLYVYYLREAKEGEKAAAGAQILEMMETTKEDHLAREFKEYLDAKSYLIVLIDIQTMEEWASIKEYFPNNNKGSRLIVYTEQVEVASLCVGAENRAPEQKKLFDNPSLYVFYKQGSADQKTITSTESGLTGRQNEEKEIISLVSNRDVQRSQILSVLGMGGIGKTTLVRSIYQSKEITDGFEKRACVTIMRPFNCVDLVNSIKNQFGDKPDLATCLAGKPYFLVLDDMWSSTEWDSIKPHLPETAGRCIIITTREESIAKHCSKEPKNICKLNTLGPDDARVLLTKKVFKDNVNLDEQYPELVKPAELILKKCSGLPLALVTVGGFLANQPKSALEWKKFYDHIIAELEINPELGVIKAILAKSYDGLPYHLKACFLYLAIFPEDYMIARRRLVHRWIAEGYSSEMRGKSADEILDGYFMELMSRTMILPSQQSIYSRKGIDSCQVHDLIREIAISKSMEDNLVFRLEAGSSLNTKGIVRHLAISSSWEGYQVEFESIVDLSHVRSLTVFGRWRPFFMSGKMRLLRVLDLEDTEGLVDHHLEHIGELLHLRYLSLRGCGDIYHLPDSMGNLRQLETLDISGTCIVKLPRTIIKLKKLQQILGKKVGQSFDEEELPKLLRNKLCFLTICSAKGCAAFCAPKSVDDAISRRDVCTAYCCNLLPFIVSGQQQNGVKVPRGIRKLKALRTLHTVDISAGKAILEDIKRLTRLRKLGVIGINKRNGKELCAAVAPLSCLESLSLRPDGKKGLSGCLDGQSSHPENLQSLKLYGKLVKLPEWIQGLKSLVKLKLEESWITKHDATIKVLGDLPNLATLRLLDSFVGAEVRLNFRRERFPSLKVLQLEYIKHLSVVFDIGATPKLELLQFRAWRGAPNVGSFSGLPHLGSLKEFKLQEYGYYESAGAGYW